MPATEWSFTCPVCQSVDIKFKCNSATCRNCRCAVTKANGAWQFLGNDQVQKYEKFLDTYTCVRTAEGRGSYDQKTLRALPLCSSSQAMADQWKIRTQSYFVLTKILKCHAPETAKILDLGAGSGWLCNRLSDLGYRPCAVDLSVDKYDGLGAAQNYETTWPCIQAEFDLLPILDNQVDAVIFNASFHYCVDPRQTLREALRVLVRGGLLLIIDSPIYADPSSGKQMLLEQQDYFEALIGERSDSIGSSGFLTWELLAAIGDELGLNWVIDKPWYGIRWALRPWKAKIRGAREPASFAILSAIAP